MGIAFTVKINYDLMKILNTSAKEPQGKTKHDIKYSPNQQGKMRTNPKLLPPSS
jgi:hypothetical protein